MAPDMWVKMASNLMPIFPLIVREQEAQLGGIHPLEQWLDYNWFSCKSADSTKEETNHECSGIVIAANEANGWSAGRSV
jgi:hypothetical protein